MAGETLKEYKTIPEDVANIGDCEGMEVKVYSRREKPNFRVISPRDFEAEFEIPNDLPTHADALVFLSYISRKRVMKKEEISALVKWLSLPSKILPEVNNFKFIRIQWKSLNEWGIEFKV